METVCAMIAIVALFGFFALRGVSNKKEREELECLKSKYNHDLEGTDKREALISGRAYYSRLRKGSPTIQDEQVLANDLSTMKG
jgi:hypothetical protein